MCRALKVLCVAPDPERLAALRRATVSADWELAPGASDEESALARLESERPHVVVVEGGMEGFVREARRRYPFLRIVADRDLPEASAVFEGLEQARRAVKGLPKPGGPVTGT